MYTSVFWLTLASHLELPVSAAHSSIGAILGMFIAYGGDDCIVWYRETGSFPFMVGVVPTILSWAVSPLLAGLVAAGVYKTIRAFVLRSRYAFDSSFWCFPVLVTLTVGLNGKHIYF